MRKNYSLFNISSLIVILSSIFLLISFQQVDDSVVTFEDPKLEQAVRDTINKEEGEILPKDVDLLQTLDASGYGIKKLDGIEALEELRELNLEDNNVQNLTPLSNLTKLESLDLRNNGITDLEKVNFQNVVFLNIRDLSLQHNVVRDNEGNDTRLSDITLIGKMDSLRKLDLRDNHIEDLSPISNLRKLRKLDVRENKFTNIKPLETLTQLEELNLRNNDIESLEPIKYSTKLKYLNIHSNSKISSLDPISNLVNLETLIMEGVPINDNGLFLKKLINLQRVNLVDTGFEEIDTDFIEELRRKGALHGEVRPIRLIHTLSAPEFTVESGFYDKAFELEIKSDVEGGVYYTLDGSEPTVESSKYTEPIQIEAIDENTLTIVRAKVISDNTMSRTVTKSYFVHNNVKERFDLPIFSLVTDPQNLFSEEIGIYHENNINNRGRDWERPIHLEYFETNGNIQLSQESGVRLHGGATRIYAQKSLRIYAESEYSNKDILSYDFFNGLKKRNKQGNLKEFKRILLRNSGNDWSQTMFNDAFMQSLVEPLGTVDTQAYQPAVVFINGEYYGIHNIRERYDEEYLSSHYDLDKDAIAILEQDGVLSYGSNSDVYHYKNLIKYIEDNGLENKANYEYIKTLMDTENYRDYFASQIYFGNADWPHNNIQFWRKTTDRFEPNAPYGHDGRWRWMLFDTDHGFYRSDNPFGDKAYPLNHTHNTIDWVMGEYDGRRGTHSWPNFLFRSLMENESFKFEFLSRMNDLFNSYFSETVVSNKIDEFVAGIKPEISHHIKRWKMPKSIDEWQSFVNNKYIFASERPQILREYIMEQFDIENMVRVSISNESEMGYVRLNTIDLTSELPGNTEEELWTGTYFEGIPITLEAVSKEGYEFSHWEGIDEQEDRVEIIPTSDVTIRAVFKNK